MAHNSRSAYPQNVLDLATGDPELGRAMPRPDLSPPFPADKGHSYQELIEAITQGYADRPAIGTRAYKIGRDPATGQNARIFRPEFQTVSYGELNARVRRLAAVWKNDRNHRVTAGDFVCIVGFSGVDYLTIELACAYAQAASVPLQATLGSDLATVFAKTVPSCVAATVEDVVAAAEAAAEHPSIRTLIAFDYDPAVDGDREQLEAARAILASGLPGAALITLGALLDRSDGEWQPLPPSPQGAGRMATLIHSSGSTGEPKGAILTEKTLMRFWSAEPKAPVIRVVFAPMNHQIGRAQIFSALARGGTAYVTAKPDLSELFTDIRLVRPTELSILPRVMEMIHRHFVGEVIQRSDGRGDEEVRGEVMAEMRRNFLGDRLCMISTGSAPTTREVKDFISECFQLPVNEGYGTTEAGSIMSNGRVLRPPVIDYKLIDAPELGYFTTDKPYPRGELWVKTDMAIPGYFKQPEAAAGLYDEEGFIRTGDIMEERAPDALVYLDRSNDVVKLSQGEFVAIGTLGSTFETGCPAIQQMYVYGNSARSFVLAVIVPDEKVVEARLGANPDESELRALIREEMRAVGAQAGLRAVEVPREFIIEHEPFSTENGLLTSVMKRKRPALNARYGKRLEALYEAIAERQNQELRALRDTGSMSVQDKVVKAIEASLGVKATGANLSGSFADLGGDSLAATAFATLLEEIFGVAVSVNLIVSPAGNIRTWAQTIERRLANQEGMVEYERIHGEDRSRLHAEHLDIAAFLDAETLETIALDPPTEPTRCVLLTGATGFLGRFLCLEWLERMEGRGGKVICLVRATDHPAAEDRLRKSYATDPALARRFAQLAEHHLEIVVGDVAEPRLGLDAKDFDSLAGRIDHIVHCGALVNHMLSYADLFGPNVAGIAQLIALALKGRQKRFDYVSSIAVARLLEPGQARTEATPLARDITLQNGYSEGYAVSKWAGETLLHSANARFGLPVNIFRCGMILANRLHAGQINQADTLTRLLYSILATESAPASFYTQAADGLPHSAHYDGLPSDFVAAAITGIGDSMRPSAVQTFHVRNQHDDGVSLDSFVDWMAAADYKIEREPDYARWLEQFEARLRALPDEKRQRSVLAVLQGYATPQIAGRNGIDNSVFVAAVSQLPMQHVPHIDKPLIDRYLEGLRLLDYIASPTGSPVVA